MPKSKPDFVDFALVKKSVSIVQILDHYGLTATLRRSGDSFSGPCPIHGGDNPTQFRVSVSKNCWNCFGQCKCGGNILDFVRKKEEVSIRQAALLIQEWFGLDCTKPKPEKPQPKPAAPAPEPVEKPGSPVEPDDATENQPLSFSLEHLDPAHPYLTERGLTPETIQTFGLGYCPKGILAGRIAIPIHNAQGQLVAYAGRWPGAPPDGQPKYKLPKGFKKSLELFNLHRAAAADASKPLIKSAIKHFRDLTISEEAEHTWIPTTCVMCAWKCATKCAGSSSNSPQNALRQCQAPQNPRQPLPFRPQFP